MVVSQSQIVRGISLMSIAFSDADVSVVVGSLLDASVHGSMRFSEKVLVKKMCSQSVVVRAAACS